MKILAISGSLRRKSYNHALLLAAAEHFPPDAEVELFDGLKAIPPYDEDDDGDRTPVAVRRFREAIAAADAILVATPEYNSSVPGQLKNAFDWASRPLATSVLRNKPVAVIGASAGAFGAVWSQAELRKVLGASGARVLDVELAVGHVAEHLEVTGEWRDDEHAEQLRDVVATLLAAVVPQVVAAAA